MAGETEGLINTLRRIEDLNGRLRRTADPTQRAAIRARLVEAEQDRDRAMSDLRAAADRGEPEAIRSLDIVETALTEEDE